MSADARMDFKQAVQPLIRAQGPKNVCPVYVTVAETLCPEILPPRPIARAPALPAVYRPRPPAEAFRIPYGFTSHGTFVRYIGNRHLLTFGPTRSGKGATVIIPALLQIPHSVLCIDPKGQNAAVTARRRRELGQAVHLLNPFDELGIGTSRLNPLARLRIDQRNVVADVRQLADALVVANERDPHWTDSARDLIAMLILYLVATKPGTATLGDMRDLLTLPESMFIEKIREMVGMRQHPAICRPAARFGQVTKEIGSVISTAITQTSFLDDPNIDYVLGGDDFDFAQLKERPTTVYVILPTNYIDEYARFFRLLVTDALNQITTRPGGYPTLMILDEFATLEGLKAVGRAFGFAAGYNVQIWPFLQDLPQLKIIYGDKWESFMANAGMVQFFTPADLTTADYLARRAGQQEVVDLTISKREISKKEAENGFSGYSSTYSKSMRPLFPTEISMSMHGSRQLLFFAGLHSAEPQGRLEYYLNPRLRGLYDRDPFHP